MLNRNELPADVQAELKRILDLEPAARTSEDVDFLRARRDYLGEEELAHLPKAKPSKASADEEEGDAAEDLSAMSLKELKKLAKAEGVEFEKNATEEDLVALITEAREAAGE